MTNPIIAQLFRGTTVESQHRGAYAVSDADGKIIASAGDVDLPVFPRSAIKAFQCLPLVASGAAHHFNLSDQEIALCCASHNGEPEHVATARSILAKAGIDEVCYECGVHWPSHREAAFELVRHGQKPAQVHNNCSGKHAGMLAFAKFSGADLKDYVKINHPVQQAIAKTLGDYCGVDIANSPVGTDGCSVPTWAIALKNLSLGFARLTNPANPAAQRILKSAIANPFYVAGSDRFDTKLMTVMPKIFAKVGAEGVYCGAIPHAGLGFALKIDDGAERAALVGAAHMLATLDIWTPEEKAQLTTLATEPLSNWRKIPVGQMSSATP